MSIHFPDWVSPALALARQTLESCHAPDSFDFVGQIDETLPREGYRMQLSPMESGKQTLRVSGGSDVGLMYGAMDFVNRIIPAAEQAHKWMFPYYFVNPFETGFAPMDETSSPSVARRVERPRGRGRFRHPGNFPPPTPHRTVRGRARSRGHPPPTGRFAGPDLQAVRRRLAPGQSPS